MFKYLSFISTFIIFVLIAINCFNLYIIKPSGEEISYFNKVYPQIDTNCKQDLLKIQNITVRFIKHELLDTSKELNTIACIKLKKGLCYDRSLLLQKYFRYKGFKIRPVYLFQTKNLINLFTKNVSSHNIFEIKIGNKWYVVETNKIQYEFYEIDVFLKKTYPNSKYIRYLNNRNGKFIWPNFIPDIYGDF